MSHYRIRLIIGSACASAALTVLLLDLLGWLKPRAAAAGLPFFASEMTGRADLSPFRIDCRAQLARVWNTSDDGSAPAYLRDDRQRLVICAQPPVPTDSGQPRAR